MPVLQFRSAGPMTLNNYTTDELTHLRSVTSNEGTKVKYITFNREVGEEGTPHLQVFAQSNTKLSVKAWHDQLGPRMANIVPTVNQERAIKYCQGFTYDAETNSYTAKPGSTAFEEYGKRPQPGQRTDLEAVTSELRKRTLREIIEDGEHDRTIIPYMASFEKIDEIHKHRRLFNAAKIEHNEYMSTRTRSQWELDLEAILDAPTDKRVIHWYVDTIGETGKTVNAKSMYFNRSAFYTTGGKSSDIFYAYQGEPIVVFNLVASQSADYQTHLYKVLEEFKDGIVSSGKYRSCTKAFPIPHVIVFSNEYPDESRMKKSRIHVHNITPGFAYVP